MRYEIYILLSFTDLVMTLSLNLCYYVNKGLVNNNTDNTLTFLLSFLPGLV
jgi:hypothetical protein